MNSIQKKIINLSLICASSILLLSSCSGGGNDRFKNAHFGDVIDYHKGETYEAKLLNDKFIDVLNGNLGGEGFIKERKVDDEVVGSDPGYVLNQNNIITQFLDEATQTPTDDGFILNIAQYNVTSYNFLYNTPGVNYKNDATDFKHSVSGLLLVPNIPADKIKGIILYYHGTESVKNSVPSCIPNPDFTKSSASNLSYCNLNDANFTKQYIAKLAGPFAAQGYIVVAPDYIGLGADYKSMHPYVVYPTANAITGLYSLQAVTQILRKEKIVPENQTYKLFTGGYSEGGAYAMEASRLAQNDYQGFLQKDNITIAAAAPAEGAYSLSEAQMNFDFADLTDGLTNKIRPEEYKNKTEEEFANLHLDNLLDCSNLEKADDPLTTKCLGPTPYQQLNNPWHVGSSLMAAIAKPYIVSYAMVAYGYYSLHNLASGYDQLMPREFWSDIPLLDSNLQPTGKHENLLQFFMDPSLENSDTLSIIAHTGKQKYNGRNYNTSSDLFLNIYEFGCDENVHKCGDRVEYEMLAPIAKEIAKQYKIDLNISFPILIKLATQQEFHLDTMGQNNSAGAFVHDNVKNLALFKKAMEDGDTYKWTTHAPIYLLSVDYDSVVPSKHSEIAYEYMHAKSPEYLKHINFHNFQIANHDRDMLLLEQPISNYVAPLPITEKMIRTYAEKYAKQLYPDSIDQQKKFIEQIVNGIKGVLFPMFGLPIDHTQAEPFTIVGALCAFEQGNAHSICKPMK